MQCSLPPHHHQQRKNAVHGRQEGFGCQLNPEELIRSNVFKLVVKSGDRRRTKKIRRKGKGKAQCNSLRGYVEKIRRRKRRSWTQRDLNGYQKKKRHSPFCPMTKANRDEPRSTVENGRRDRMINTECNCESSFSWKIFYAEQFRGVSNSWKECNANSPGSG